MKYLFSYFSFFIKILSINFLFLIAKNIEIQTEHYLIYVCVTDKKIKQFDYVYNVYGIFTKKKT